MLTQFTRPFCTMATASSLPMSGNLAVGSFGGRTVADQKSNRGCHDKNGSTILVGSIRGNSSLDPFYWVSRRQPIRASSLAHSGLNRLGCARCPCSTSLLRFPSGKPLKILRLPAADEHRHGAGTAAAPPAPPPRRASAPFPQPPAPPPVPHLHLRHAPVRLHRPPPPLRPL